MGTYIALLRGINVGRKQVPMAELRELLRRLGFAHVKSALASGNLIFETPSYGSEALERLLQTEFEKALHLETDVMVRTAEEWREVVMHNAFPAEAQLDPAHVVAMLLKSVPSSKRILTLRGAIQGRERIEPGAQHLYITYPDGIGNSRLTNVIIERTLGVRGTMRNWNTVLKLLSMAAYDYSSES